MKDRSLWKPALAFGMILLGVALLCSNLGIFPGLWSFIAGLWPIALIAVGLAVVLGWQKGWRLPWQQGGTTPFNEPLGQLRTATLDLSSSAGELEIEAAGPTSQDLLGGKIPASSQALVESGGQAAVVRLRHQQPLANLPIIGTRSAWDLRLHPNVVWSLRLDGSIGDAELDLGDLRVQELHVGGQVGEAKVKLPRRGQTVVRISGQVDELLLRVPDGVAARIQLPGGSASPAAATSGGTRIDTGRFPLRGDAYESPGFASAVDWVEITLDAPAINLRVF